MAMLLTLSVFVTPSVARADDPAPVEGPTITADPASPTGYTVTFVYYNPNATQVRLAGDLTLRGIGEGTTRFQPEAWQLGRYHSGGVEFLRDMTKSGRVRLENDQIQPNLLDRSQVYRMATDFGVLSNFPNGSSTQMGKVAGDQCNSVRQSNWMSMAYVTRQFSSVANSVFLLLEMAAGRSLAADQ